VTPTRPRLLVALVAISAAVGWGTSRLVDAYADRSLPVPWTAALVMLLLALALALWARGTRARLTGQPGTKPMDPIVAARSAALGMAAARTGAIVAGFYLGVSIELAPGWGFAHVRERVVVSLVTVLLAGLVVAAALWLERVCRVPPDSSDDPKA
jgi:4-amino-4-deoxy-L-arabinose transferase-like glycosyltransferase